jgi:hypothetical protein
MPVYTDLAILVELHKWLILLRKIRLVLGAEQIKICLDSNLSRKRSRYSKSKVNSKTISYIRCSKR